jgi:hypothetical protein
MVLIDLIVNGQTCVAQRILRNMIDRVWAALGKLCLAVCYKKVKIKTLLG